MRLLFFPFLQVDHARLRLYLEGKTVLITGASYGIGECLAAALATTPAHLILVARTEARLLMVQQRVAASGGRADIFSLRFEKSDRGTSLAGLP